MLPRLLFPRIRFFPVNPHRTIVRCEDTLPSNRLDIAELVTILEKENAKDIFVCRVPKDVKYVDYFVVCSSSNYRNMSALAEIVRKCFKEKNEGKIIGLPSIEGPRSRDWMALDLGNVALHIMSAKAREIYDLEYLWAVGDPPMPPDS